jgi:hypothetical protein
VAGGWWLVAGGWWLVAGGWWLVVQVAARKNHTADAPRISNAVSKETIRR